MNYRMIGYLQGRIMQVEAVLMLFPLACAIIYREKSAWAFVGTIALLMVFGLVLTVKPPKNKTMSSRDGFITVGLAWILLSIFGALPFYFSGQISSFVDCIFETVSGFTTTGASILPEVEVLDKGMLFWRSFTHWIGGMGVLVFVLAILPQSDIKSSRLMHVMRAEVPGPTVGKITAKIKTTATILYMIYIAMTLIEIILLLCGGMPLFDSLVNSFGTAGTGGFSVRNISIAAYESQYVEYVISIFMLLFSINFNLFYLICTGHILRTLKSEELRWFVGIVAVAVVIIAVDIYSIYHNAADCFRLSLFQVASVISTTGYSTADFNQWPVLSQTILVMLMFIGACAGSTGGGIKVGRLIILVKNSLREIKYIHHPRSVISVRFESKPVEAETLRSTSSFFLIYAMMFSTSVLLLSLLNNFDLVTNFTSVAACFNNIGPGLGIVGPLGNFGSFSAISKLLLSFLMLAGRLEIFPMLLLFSPSSWKK